MNPIHHARARRRLLQQSAVAIHAARAYALFEAVHRVTGLGMADATLYAREGNIPALESRTQDVLDSLDEPTQRMVYATRAGLLGAQ